MAVPATLMQAGRAWGAQWDRLYYSAQYDAIQQAACVDGSCSRRQQSPTLLIAQSAGGKFAAGTEDDDGPAEHPAT